VLPLLALGQAWSPVVRGFSALLRVDQLGISGKDEHRRETRWQDVGLAYVVVLEVKLIKLAGCWHRDEADTQRKLGCIGFSQFLSPIGDKC